MKRLLKSQYGRAAALSVAFLLCLSSTASVVNAGVLSLSDVKVNDTIDATAAYGNIAGNDNVLLGLLNDGGSGTFLDPNTPGNPVPLPAGTWTISSTGMFSTDTDLTAGVELGELTWFFGGKSDDLPSNGPFTSNPGGTTGTLILDSTLFTSGPGDVVISLKAGSGYSVFAFEGVENVTHFTFNTQSIMTATGGPFALSHASLYTIPEPMSLAIWGVGILGLAGARRRRKSKKSRSVLDEDLSR